MNVRDLKRSKYGNKPTNGYASKRESNRAQELKLLEAADQVRNIKEQVPFLLIPSQTREGRVIERSCRYVADFAYDIRIRPGDNDSWMQVVEDAKGYRDPVYRIKRKLMLKVHGIRIREV